MLLQIALLLITAIVLAFLFAWMRWPQLRRTLEEPKYVLFDQGVAENQSPSISAASESEGGSATSRSGDG